MTETRHDEIRAVVTTAQSGGGMFAAEVTIPAGGGPPVLHRHESFEFYRMQEGELAFYVQGEDGGIERTTAVAGETVAIPGNAEHTIRNETDEGASAFAVFSPGTDMEPFAAAASALHDPSPEEITAVAASHGIEITRPLAEVTR